MTAINVDSSKIEKGKLKCTECEYIGTIETMDKVTDPKPIEGTTPDIWTVCPECRMPEHFVLLCDEPGCKKEVTCGTPIPDGYRQTCPEHKP